MVTPKPVVLVCFGLSLVTYRTPIAAIPALGEYGSTLIKSKTTSYSGLLAWATGTHKA